MSSGSFGYIQLRSLSATDMTATVVAEASAWIAGARDVLDEYRRKGAVPYAHRVAAVRWAKCAVLPVCCFPCGLWSFVMRAFACPVQCCVRGTGYACSDNGCTRVTDDCVGAAHADTWRRVALPAMPRPDKLSESERAAMSTVLKEALAELLKAGPDGMYNMGHYRLMDALFKSTIGHRSHPKGATEFIRTRLVELGPHT